MTLVDPKSGVAYAAGEKLPSAHVNSVWAQQPRALDAVNGGTYACNGAITVNNAGAGSITYGSTLNVTWTGTTNLPQLGSRTYRRMQRLSFVGSTAFGGTANFSHSSVSGVISQDYVDTSGTNDPLCFFPLDNLIDGATLTAVGVVIDPASGTPPTEAPKLQVYKFPNNGAGTTVGSETADPTSGASYGSIHSFSVSGLSEAIDESGTPTCYMLRFKGESGSGSTTGLLIAQVFCDFTVTKIGPGG